MQIDFVTKLQNRKRVRQQRLS